MSHKSGSSVIFNINDITKEKKAERDLLKSEKRLKKMNEVKDLFFSVIAHDLRNPIGSIYNLTGLILDKSEERTEQEKELYIRSIHDTTLGLNNLLENLFSWSKSQQKSIVAVPEQLSVFDVCNAIIDSQITHAIFKNITIENEVEQNQLAFFDKELTRVIIRNLLSNSIKYSNENSTIVISSSNDDSNGSVLIHVTDSGLGIKESRLENLFDIGEKELTKGTKNEKGSGMGLVLCKEFAELQSGKITVKSELGKGSTFTLKLPQVPVI